MVKMNERQKWQQLFQFDLWCTRKLCDLFMENKPFDDEAACTAFTSHIINAQEMWYDRVIGQSGSENFNLWTEYSLSDIKNRARKSHKKWITLIGDHEVDLDTHIYYKNTKGIDFYSSICEICQHLIVHGQHHRAQISIFLRKCDINPSPIDYMHYAGINN